MNNNDKGNKDSDSVNNYRMTRVEKFHDSMIEHNLVRKKATKATS